MAQGLNSEAAPSPMRLGVFGDPVSHSRSPWIHHRFAEQTGVAVDYRAYPVTAAELPDALTRFAAIGGAGLNLTVPHKQAVLAHCHSLSPRAQAAGAVNTLVRLPSPTDAQAVRWHGDNTDGLGLLWDLQRQAGRGLGGRPLVVVGLGGAAAGVLPSLLQISQPWTRVILANRSLEKVQLWWQHQSGQLSEWARCPVELVALDRLHIPAQALLINATACGHQGLCPDLPIPSGAGQAYDLNYAAAAQPFLDWAGKQAGWQCQDGLGMLVGQAAAAFQAWTGILPDALPVLTELRALLGR